MSSGPKILISGSGIAGGAFAFCLLRAYPDANITIIERDPTPRLTGASVDIRNSAVEVIKWMGLEPTIRKHTTQEEGLQFVGSTGKPFATFRQTGRTDIQSFSSEYEIFRGALAKSFMDPISDKVKMVFNETVQHFEEFEKGITVTFTTSQRKETFDLLVAADGLGSRIRGTMLGTRPREQIHEEGIHAAYFTVEKDLLGGKKMAKWHNLAGGKVIMLRPDPHPEGRTRAHFMNVTWKSQTDMRARLDRAQEEGHDAYRALLEEQFRGGGWLCGEVLDEMYKSPDFYCSFFAKVRSPKMHDGRVVLLGDAGYATPGIGTSLAIIGSHILAGELLAHPDDYAAALLNYEQHMKKLVANEQGTGGDIMMQLMNPQSQWGVSIRNAVIWLFAATRVDHMMMVVAGWVGWTNVTFPLPKYEWPQKKA